MRINHNIAALNTYNQLNQNNNVQQKSLEKLSSGMRINSAADDAAGLAISEKMRGQVRGLDMATKNSEDGISMIQTAEGALNETHSIAQRMRELAVQAASDTNTQDDRKEIQEEVDQLAKEITRIGETTEFNTQKLLNGELEGAFQIGANEGQNLELGIGDMRAFNLGVAGDVKAELEGSVSTGNVEVDDGTYTVEEVDADLAGTTILNDNDGYELTEGEYILRDEDNEIVAASTNGSEYYFESTDDGTSGLDTSGTSIAFDYPVTDGEVEVEGDSVTATVPIENDGLEPGEYKAVNDDGTHILENTDGEQIATFGEVDGTSGYVDASSGELLFETGDPLTSNTNDGDEVDISVGGLDVSSQEKADEAISSMDSAIQDISSQRSDLGAVQNRLEHTINNLGTSSENISAAESRIRDVDYAEAA